MEEGTSQLSTGIAYLYTVVMGGMGGLLLSKKKERGIGRLVHKFYRRRAIRRARKFGKQKLAIGHFHHSSHVITVQKYLENLSHQVQGHDLDTDTRELVDSLGKALSEVTELVSSIFQPNSQLPKLVKSFKKESDRIRKSSLVFDISSSIQLEISQLKDAASNLDEVRGEVQVLAELTKDRLESEEDEGLKNILATTHSSLTEIIRTISTYQDLLARSQELYSEITTSEDIKNADDESEFLKAVEEYIELLHPDKTRWRR